MIFTFANWVTVFWILFLCLSIICSLDFLFFFCVGNFAYLNSVLLYSDRTLHFCTISNGVVSPSLFLSNVETTPWKISLVFFLLRCVNKGEKNHGPRVPEQMSTLICGKQVGRERGTMQAGNDIKSSPGEDREGMGRLQPAKCCRN